VTGSKPRRPLRDGLGFLGAFLRRPTSVGAVLPSSRYLSRALVGRLELQPGQVVIEFGPGTGPVTEVLNEQLPAGCRYLGIELDPGFHALLQQRYPKLEFVCACAGDAVELLRARGLPMPVRIISGLPFASLPATVQDSVIDSVVDCLRSGGEFRTFQYVHAYGLKAARRFRSRMAERFHGFERVGPVLRNVPPAFVLRYWHVR
jgi:phospholipid N-methyltransferase